MKDNKKNEKRNIKSASTARANPQRVKKQLGVPDSYEVPNFKKTGKASNNTKTKVAPPEPSATKAHVKNNKKNKKTKTGKNARVLSPLILLVVAVVLVLAIFGSNLVSGQGSFISSLGSGGGYPVTIDNTGLISTQRIGSGIMLLSNDSVEILNSTAKEGIRVQHTFLNPEADIANGRAIIYCRVSGRVEVVNRSGVLYKTDLERNILTASVGKKGNIAIATQSISAQSDLIVLDKKGKTIFSWECAADRISAVALSDNGKSVAVAVVGAANADLYSRVLVFNFDKSEPVVEFDYPEEVIIKLKFGSNDTLLALGDKMFSVISVKDNKKQDNENASDDVLDRFHIYENGKTAMILSPFGNKTLSKLVVYGSAGDLLFETSCNQDVKWVSCDENYVSVLTQDEVQCFDNTGNRLGVFEADKYSERVVVVGKYTYLFEKGLITQYNTVGLSR